MRASRVLFAALLFLAFTLGVPVHAATSHVCQPTGDASPAHTVAHHGKGHCCPDHDRKSGSSTLCQMACGVSLTIPEAPPMSGTRLAYAVQFTPELHAVRAGVSLPLDPFPPRPFRIA
jgi:hypothetical protein